MTQPWHNPGVSSTSRLDRSLFSHFPAVFTPARPSCAQWLFPPMCRIPGRRRRWNGKGKAELETFQRLGKCRVVPGQGGNNWKEKQGGIFQRDRRLLQTLPSSPGIIAAPRDGLGEREKREEIPKKPRDVALQRGKSNPDKEFLVFQRRGNEKCFKVIPSPIQPWIVVFPILIFPESSPPR